MYIHSDGNLQHLNGNHKALVDMMFHIIVVGSETVHNYGGWEEKVMEMRIVIQLSWI